MGWRQTAEGMRGLSIVFVSGAVLSSAWAGEPRLNQIQVIGTHNSYHLAPDPAVRALIAATGRQRAEAIDYSHRPLAEQFSRLGIRQIELDLYADPEGKLFAEPAARKILSGLGKDPGPDPDPEGRLRKPGMKVLHLPDVDYRTTVPTLVEALKQVRAWSQANRRHVPILILLELKSERVPGLPARPIPFTSRELEAVDAEILSVFPREAILTPDRLRGRFATLPEAIKADGWPTLDSVRGLVFFALDNEGSVRDLYLEGRPALRGRSCSRPSPPRTPRRRGSRSTIQSGASTGSRSWSAKGSWFARGLTPIRWRPDRAPSPSATRRWPAVPSSSAPIIPSPIRSSPATGWVFPAESWLDPIR